ncbi:MAG: ArsR family transcriptional regulator [Ornithinimicrobium sp.]
MNIEQTGLVRRARTHAALADVTRLRIVDQLSTSDASASELSGALDIPSNLLAHHLSVLDAAELIDRRQSEGDRRRNYLSLRQRETWMDVEAVAGREPAPGRVIFVCTANTARSHLAAAMWRQASPIRASSAGTHPGPAINPDAMLAAQRHGLAMPEIAPVRLADAMQEDDFVVTVCDRAHEELAGRTHAHWSIPDPVPDGSSAAFDTAHAELADRIHSLAPRWVG